jgi:hypothetical protein
VEYGCDLVEQLHRLSRAEAPALRLAAQNVFNNVTYDTFGSQSIQSSVFGRLNAATDFVVNNSPRRMQLSAKYTF